MAGYRVISSNSHVYETLDLWTSRAAPSLKDRMPHIEHHEDGDWWFCDGYKIQGTMDATQAGVRFEDQSKFSSDQARGRDPAGGLDSRRACQRHGC